jgi:type IV pilus assembly protein PilQ
MESQGEGKIISAPKVVTLDNKKASIKQGLSYPYQSVDNGIAKIEFKDVDLLLDVTPHVTPDNRISMNLKITKNDIGEVISGEQSFTKKEAKTELLVNDGDTVVIGGIIKTTENDSTTGIPGLSKIPILGWFFKKEEKIQRKEELLIFMTPRIVQLEQKTVQ